MKFETTDADRLADPLRRRLVLGLPSGMALASPLALIACGGGGGGDDPGPGGSGTPDPDQAKAEALAATLGWRRLQLPGHLPPAQPVGPSAGLGGLDRFRRSAHRPRQVRRDDHAAGLSPEGEGP